MIVLALDPGGTTGYTICEVLDGEISKIESGQAKLSEADLWSMLESIKPSYVVAEAFEYRQDQRDGLVLTSRNLLGVSALWAELRDAHYRTQSAAQGKAFFSNSKLRSLEMYIPGKEHARDSLRHLLTFLAFGSPLLSTRERHRIVANEVLSEQATVVGLAGKKSR
jgi:hypothetical protein